MQKSCNNTRLTRPAGWTIFDKLYFVNGTFFLVTDDPHAVPELKHMISTGIGIQNGADEARRRLPTEKEMRVVDPETAKRLFGVQAERLDGVTVSIISKNSISLLTVAFCSCSSMTQNNCTFHAFVLRPHR